MRRILATALAATAVAAVPAACSPPTADQATSTESGAATDAVADARAAMRRLWEDHITWTRIYLVDALAGLPDTDATTARLLRNQQDIGAAIVPYYGQEAGDRLAALLNEHIAIATDVLKAAKAGDDAQVTAQQRRWSANADEIASFLSDANPNLDRAILRDGLQKHLDLTTEQVVSRLKQDRAADIAAYDANHEHMLMFSDMLTDAIAKQHPEKFAAAAAAAG